MTSCSIFSEFFAIKVRSSALFAIWLAMDQQHFFNKDDDDDDDDVAVDDDVDYAYEHVHVHNDDDDDDDDDDHADFAQRRRRQCVKSSSSNI